MKYETHCDDSGVGMFKMASGVSFVKQKIVQQRAQNTTMQGAVRDSFIPVPDYNIVCVLDCFSHSDSSYKLESVVGNIHFI